MPSTDRRRLIAILLLAGTLVSPVAARQEAAPPAHTPEEIARALETVKKDPNLGGEQLIKFPKWRERDARPSTTSWAWLRDFIGWIMQSGRYLVWAVLVFLAVWLAVYLTRAIRGRRETPAADAFVAPTHVRNLDIRPESLPANIGRAARALWDNGEPRAALSLLYRGLLSRLTHVHRVPITDSSTEGDCLALLSGRVSPATSQYSVRLVDAWRDVVYGGAAQPATAMHALCDDFSGALDRGAAKPAGGGTE